MLRSPIIKEGAFMPEPLLLLAIVVPILVVGYGVQKWATRIEERTRARQTMDRVYYPWRGGKTDVPELRRRPQTERKGTNR